MNEYLNKLGWFVDVELGSSGGGVNRSLNAASYQYVIFDRIKNKKRGNVY